MAKTALTADELAEKLGHSFADPSLLARALTHPSATEPSYERMEFLGDRVLGLALADVLFHRFPGESEGGLARRLSKLASRDSLAEVARAIGLVAHVRISDGAKANDSILADCCEAVLAALYLDGGMQAARRFIETAWEDLIAADAMPPREAKTALQEWAQSRGIARPGYGIVSQSGPPHAPEFTVEVFLAGEPPERGMGRTKREAERAAAEAMLERLERRTRPIE
jgi:ribonuclease-3